MLLWVHDRLLNVLTIVNKIEPHFLYRFNLCNVYYAMSKLKWCLKGNRLLLNNNLWEY